MLPILLSAALAAPAFDREGVPEAWGPLAAQAWAEGALRLGLEQPVRG